MRIAIASNDRKRVAGHIGRCRTFMLFDVENGTVRPAGVRENGFTAHHDGGAAHEHEAGEHRHGEGAGAHHARLTEGLKDCAALICAGGGWRAVEDLRAHRIDVLFTDVEGVEEAAARFADGTLVHDAERTCRRHE